MNKMLKTFIVFISAALFAVLFTNIYALFGHDVRSKYMDLMFLVPFAAALPFLCMYFFRSGIYKNKGYRLFLNTYSSGVATLTSGLLLRGILRIAGGSSGIAPWFIYIGASVTAIGILMLIILLINAKTKGNQNIG